MIDPIHKTTAWLTKLKCLPSVGIKQPLSAIPKQRNHKVTDF